MIERRKSTCGRDELALTQHLQLHGDYGSRREGASIRILHVDDEPDIREFVETSLRLDPAFAVRGCASGTAAFATAADWTPDLILLDLMMPGMDGFQLVARLHDDPAWRDIPVIIVTERDITAEDRKRLNSAVEAVLLKGAFAPGQLVDCIRQLLRPPEAPESLPDVMP